MDTKKLMNWITTGNTDGRLNKDEDTIKEPIEYPVGIRKDEEIDYSNEDERDFEG